MQRTRSGGSSNSNSSGGGDDKEEGPQKKTTASSQKKRRGLVSPSDSSPSSTGRTGKDEEEQEEGGGGDEMLMTAAAEKADGAERPSESSCSNKDRRALTRHSFGLVASPRRKPTLGPHHPELSVSSDNHEEKEEVKEVVKDKRTPSFGQRALSSVCVRSISDLQKAAAKARAAAREARTAAVKAKDRIRGGGGGAGRSKAGLITPPSRRAPSAANVPALSLSSEGSDLAALPAFLRSGALNSHHTNTARAHGEKLARAEEGEKPLVAAKKAVVEETASGAVTPASGGGHLRRALKVLDPPEEEDDAGAHTNHEPAARGHHHHHSHKRSPNAGASPEISKLAAQQKSRRPHRREDRLQDGERKATREPAGREYGHHSRKAAHATAEAAKPTHHHHRHHRRPPVTVGAVIESTSGRAYYHGQMRLHEALRDAEPERAGAVGEVRGGSLEA